MGYHASASHRDESYRVVVVDIEHVARRVFGAENLYLGHGGIHTKGRHGAIERISRRVFCQDFALDIDILSAGSIGFARCQNAQ